MKIKLNDIEKEIAYLATPTLAKLVESEGISKHGTAIAVNNKIVKKALWDATILRDGDEVSVVTIAFGG